MVSLTMQNLENQDSESVSLTQNLETQDYEPLSMEQLCDIELYNEKLSYDAQCMYLDDQIKEYRRDPNFLTIIALVDKMLQFEAELKRENSTRFTYYDCTVCGGTTRLTVTRQCNCQAGFRTTYGVYPIQSYRTPCGNCHSGFYTVDKGKCGHCVNGYQRVESESFIKKVNEYNNQIKVYADEIQFYDNFNDLLNRKEKLKSAHEKNNLNIRKKFFSPQQKILDPQPPTSVKKDTINTRVRLSKNKNVSKKQDTVPVRSRNNNPTCADVMRSITEFIGAVVLFIPRVITAKCCTGER